MKMSIVSVTIVFHMLIGTLLAVDVKTINCEDAPNGAVEWVADLGTYSGQVTITERLVVAGTNSGANEADEFAALSAFNRNSGVLEWRIKHTRSPHTVERIRSPIKSRALHFNRKFFYVDNQGALRCIKDDGNEIWKYNYGEELKVKLREANEWGNPTTSPLQFMNALYLSSGYGRFPDDTNETAPSLLCVSLDGKLKWNATIRTRDLIYGQWSSAVAISNETNPQIIFGAGDATLYSFNPESGQLLWSQRFDDRISMDTTFVSTPILMEGRLYFGLNHDVEAPKFSPIYCVNILKDAVGSRIEWSYRNESFGGTFGNVLPTPAGVYALGSSGILVCLDPKSGKERWRIVLNQDPGGFVSPVASNGYLYIGTRQGNLIVISIEDKAIIGQYYLGEGIEFSPEVYGGHLYVATHSRLYRLKEWRDIK